MIKNLDNRHLLGIIAAVGAVENDIDLPRHGRGSDMFHAALEARDWARDVLASRQEPRGRFSAEIDRNKVKFYLRFYNRREAAEALGISQTQLRNALEVRSR